MRYKLASKNDLLKTNHRVESLEEGNKIVEILKLAIKQFHDEKIPVLVLSAPMIGINKRVIISVCDTIEPKIFINPEIVNKGQDLVAFNELNPCVSRKIYKTVRHASVTIKDDSTSVPRIFSNKNPLGSGIQDDSLRESCILQEQIELLNNILLCNNQDIKLNKFNKKQDVQKYGRNDKVYIEKDGESQFIKYKFAKELIEKENWKLI